MFWKKKPAPEALPDIRYAHPSHEAFNKALEEKRNPPPKSVDLSGPWMKPEVLARLPELRGDFDMNRDPQARLEQRSLSKADSRQRGDQSSGGSKMIEKESPTPAFRPDDARAKAVDRAHFNGRWMAEQRDNVMTFAAPDQSQQQNGREYNRSLPVPKI